jgi:SAM-dependent methyltransferase
LSAVANEAETRRWNDDRWAAAWPRRERLTETVSPYLLEATRARPGQRVCDIGCGGGTLTIAVARAVHPGGRAVGIDLSAPLLQLARERAGESGVDNVDFVRMDVQTGSFEGEPFELAVSQFGVMFFDEPLAAFGAVRSLLVRGGRLVFACWQGVEHNPWHMGSALRPLVPPRPTPPPGKSPVGPFVLGDDEYVRDVLGGAGFAAVESTPHETTVRAPADAVVDRSLLPFMGIPPGREEEAMTLVERHLDRFVVGPDQYEYPLAFTVFQAVNP